MNALDGSTTFVRLVDARYEDCLNALDRMTRRAGPSGLLIGGHRAFWLRGSRDTCELEIHLRRGRLGREVQMRLQVISRSSLRELTQLEMVPCRAVRPDGNYYAVGHAFLDRLVEALRGLTLEVLDVRDAI